MIKKLQKSILIIFLMVSVNIVAQNYKFGKVSKEELQEGSHPLDSAANAVVLYESKNVNFVYGSNGFELVTEVFKRVKLYNKDGFDYASDEMSLYKRNRDEEQIVGLKGVTYSLVNGKIVETKLGKDGIFENELSENYDQIKFTMPSLKEGSVIEYKYKITSPFFYNLDRVFLQYSIPAKKIEVKIKAPEYFNFKKFSTGYLPINLKEASYNGKLTHRTSSEITSRGRVAGSSQVIEFSGTEYNIHSENVPALKREPFSGNTQNYVSSLVFELASTKFPNSIIENYSTTWENVVKTVYKSPRFGGELKKNSYYEEDIAQLVKGVNDPVKKTSLIFNFVKQKMTWDKMYSVYSRKGLKKAYKEGTGNAAEINLMLTSMLSSVGVNANPVVAISSYKTISLFPTLDGFNYVITRVKLPNDQIMYLDASDKYGMPNILPDRIIQGIGRVIGDNGTSQMVSFRLKKPSLNSFRVQCEIDEEGIAKGVLGVNRQDYLAHNFRTKHAIKNEESKIKRFETMYGLSDIEEYSVKGVKEYGKGVNEKFNFSIEDQIEVIDDEMFFSPLLFLRDKENIFKSDDRSYPIDFGYGFSNRYMVNIKIPEGYKVVECPKGSAFKLPENMGKFSFKSNVSNGNIQISVEETISSSVIPVNYYPAIKEFYTQVIEKENEQVVLKKI